MTMSFIVSNLKDSICFLSICHISQVRTMINCFLLNSAGIPSGFEIADSKLTKQDHILHTGKRKLFRNAIESDLLYTNSTEGECIRHNWRSFLFTFRRKFHISMSGSVQSSLNLNDKFNYGMVLLWMNRNNRKTYSLG